jgi:uncharacterized protein YceK
MGALHFMKKTVLFFVAALLLTGCATVYTKPGKTEADFEKDRIACEATVKKNLAARSLPDT